MFNGLLAVLLVAEMRRQWREHRERREHEEWRLAIWRRFLAGDRPRPRYRRRRLRG